MMDAGRSFSGNERNCFFINLGNGKFTDISGLSGLDFPDDGRAISVTDWDNDGDLDLWITNRNAPRLRLMRNDTKEDNPFISILLKGNGETVNKDAIGARIEIINGKNSEKFKQIQTLRAGQGFLSQSSKWIQFALNETIKSINIKISWPDGTVSKIEDVLPNKKYIIRQESSTAEEIKLESKKSNLVNSPGLKNPPSQVARVPAITLFKGPTINLRKNGIDISFPVSADTAFTGDLLKKTDAYLAMYHDQALPVLKALSFGKAINITLGVPIIRTSVDHGVALDVAGKDSSNFSSLLEAFKAAKKLIK